MKFIPGFCRICAQDDGINIDIFQPENVLNLQRIHKLLPIKIKHSDVLPKTICHLCLCSVIEMNEFYDKCSEAQNKLVLHFIGGKATTEMKTGNSNENEQAVNDQQTAPSLPIVIEDETNNPRENNNDDNINKNKNKLAEDKEQSELLNGNNSDYQDSKDIQNKVCNNNSDDEKTGKDEKFVQKDKQTVQFDKTNDKKRLLVIDSEKAKGNDKRIEEKWSKLSRNDKSMIIGRISREGNTKKRQMIIDSEKSIKSDDDKDTEQKRPKLSRNDKSITEMTNTEVVDNEICRKSDKNLLSVSSVSRHNERNSKHKKVDSKKSIESDEDKDRKLPKLSRNDKSITEMINTEVVDNEKCRKSDKNLLSVSSVSRQDERNSKHKKVDSKKSIESDEDKDRKLPKLSRNDKSITEMINTEVVDNEKCRKSDKNLLPVSSVSRQDERNSKHKKVDSKKSIESDEDKEIEQKRPKLNRNDKSMMIRRIHTEVVYNEKCRKSNKNMLSKIDKKKRENPSDQAIKTRTVEHGVQFLSRNFVPIPEELNRDNHKTSCTEKPNETNTSRDPDQWITTEISGKSFFICKYCDAFLLYESLMSTHKCNF